MRLSKKQYGLLQALAASSRSEDPHTKVGCAVENHEGRIVATGYNGLPPKIELPARLTLEENRVEKAALMIHAEANALSLVNHGSAHTLYCTISPCGACCSLAAANKVKKIVFLKEYLVNGAPDQSYKAKLAFYGIGYELATEDDIRAIKNTLAQRIKELL